MNFPEDKCLPVHLECVILQVTFLLRAVLLQLPHVSPQLPPGLLGSPRHFLRHHDRQSGLESSEGKIGINYCRATYDVNLELAKTSNLSLKNSKVTKTGRQPMISGPADIRLTPRILSCLWMFSSSREENSVKDPDGRSGNTLD